MAGNEHRIQEPWSSWSELEGWPGGRLVAAERNVADWMFTPHFECESMCS